MNNKGFIGLLSLLIVCVIIVFLGFKAYTHYLGNPTARTDEPTRTMAEEAGIDVSSQMGVLESTKAKIKEIEQNQVNRPQEILDSTLNQLPK